MGQGGGSWTRAPGGGVVASFSETDPSVDFCAFLEVFILAGTRSEAVKRARRLGLHGVSLKTGPGSVLDEDVNALVSSGCDALWRREDDEPGRYRTLDEWPIRSV